MKIPIFINTNTNSSKISPTVVLGTGCWDIEHSSKDQFESLMIYVDGSQFTEPVIIVGDIPSIVYAEVSNSREFSLWVSRQLS